MAVRSFLHYALEVPDQAVGQRFYEDFGLVDGTGSSDAVRLRPERLGRDTVLLYEGPRKRLHHLCYGAPGRGLRAGARGAPERGGAPRWTRPPAPPRAASGSAIRTATSVNVRDEAAPAPPADPPVTLNGPGYTPARGRAGLSGARPAGGPAQARPRPALHPRHGAPHATSTPGRSA